jgi:protein TonB
MPVGAAEPAWLVVTAPRWPRAVGAGLALSLHGGVAAWLLLAPPAQALQEPVLIPLQAVLADPVMEESEAPAAQQAEAQPAQSPPPEPAPPEPAPPEPPQPEPPPPEPEPEPEPPPPEPAPEPAPEPPPPEPPRPAPPPPRPAPPRQPVARVPASATMPSPAPSTAAAASPGPPAPVAASGPPPSYLQALAGALERQKRYPDGARARRASGVAMLRFTVLRDGRVARWQIARGSGDAELDSAVEQMIQRATLPAFPAGMEGDLLEVTVPVRFQIR